MFGNTLFSNSDTLTLQHSCPVVHHEKVPVYLGSTYVGERRVFKKFMENEAKILKMLEFQKYLRPSKLVFSFCHTHFATQVLKYPHENGSLLQQSNHASTVAKLHTLPESSWLKVRRMSKKDAFLLSSQLSLWKWSFFFKAILMTSIFHYSLFFNQSRVKCTSEIFTSSMHLCYIYVCVNVAQSASLLSHSENPHSHSLFSPLHFLSLGPRSLGWPGCWRTEITCSQAGCCLQQKTAA